jgi:hypothetical protein
VHAMQLRSLRKRSLLCQRSGQCLSASILSCCVCCQLFASSLSGPEAWGLYASCFVSSYLIRMHRVRLLGGPLLFRVHLNAWEERIGATSRHNQKLGDVQGHLW